MILEIDQIPLKGLTMRLKPFFRLLDQEFLGEHVKNLKMGFKMSNMRFGKFFIHTRGYLVSSMCRYRLLWLSWGFFAHSCKVFSGSEYSSRPIRVYYRSIWVMIATDILFTISICVTCRLRRNILGKLANMSSTVCSRTTSLRINSYFMSAKSWLAIHLRSITSYWKNNQITEEDWVQTIVIRWFHRVSTTVTWSFCFQAQNLSICRAQWGDDFGRIRFLQKC